MTKIAQLLGKKEVAEAYQKKMKLVFEEYNLQFLDDQTGRYANGSQAAQAMSLIVGLVPEEYQDKVVSQLKDDVVKRGYAITAGDVGHPFLIAALMKYGMSDVLNEMTNITDKPGYGYQVVNGATTLTEEWDGPEPGNIHGSQNHLMPVSYTHLDVYKRQVFKSAVQTISYIPHFLSVVVICSMLNGFGSTTGLFNDVRDFLGMARVDMNNGSQYFLPLYLGSQVWQTVG